MSKTRIFPTTNRYAIPFSISILCSLWLLRNTKFKLRTR